MVHIAEIRMIEADIDGFSGRNDLGLIMRVINRLKFIPLKLGAL